MDKELENKLIKTIQFECLISKKYLLKNLSEINFNSKQLKEIDEVYNFLILNLVEKIKHPETLEN